MPNFDVTRMPAVADRLWSRVECWGWEFHDPGEAQQHPLAQRPPQFVEPPSMDLGSAYQTIAKGREKLLKHAVIAGVVFLLGLGSGQAGILFVLIGLGLGAFWFLPMILAQQKISQANSQRAALRQAEWDKIRCSQGAVAAGGC